MVTGGKISESAYLCLKLAWIYRGEIQEAKANGAAQERISMYEKYEKEYLEDAYRGFKQARETEYPPIAGMDENTITYLLTSIGIHCGKIDEARRYGSALLISRTASMKLKNSKTMPRSVNHVASKARRKKILKLTRGYFGARKNVWTVAKNTWEKGLTYAFRDRRNKKRNFRALWIQRINAAARLEGMSYSKLMGGLHKAGIEINRKVLADLAVNHPEAFKAVVAKAKVA